jgi:hypothetical protein
MISASRAAPDAQSVRRAGHRRERGQRGELMTERRLDEMISDQERRIAGILGPARGAQQRRGRARVLAEHSEPKGSRAGHGRIRLADPDAGGPSARGNG